MKKRFAFLATASLLFLVPQLVVTERVQAGTSTVTAKQDMTWYGNTTLDEADNYVGKIPEVEQTAIQFDLPNLSGQTITRATLRLNVSANTSEIGIVPYIDVYGSTVDNWLAVYPAFPMNVSDQILQTVPVGTGYLGPIDIDVTSFVRGQMDGIASFALLGNDTFNGPGDYEIAISTDATGTPPQLILETQVPTKAPTITPSTPTTTEDSNVSGLVISKDSSDATAVTHYKISSITGGRLYRSNDAVINDDSYITAAEGTAGLKFVPDQDANSLTGTFSFNVQAAQDSNGTGLSTASNVVITVAEVNDKPVPADDSWHSIEQNSGDNVIPFASLLANDSVGAANESGQTLEIVDVNADPSVGTVRTQGTNVIFTPAQDKSGPASFTYKVKDNGTTNGNPDPQTSDIAAAVTFNINAPTNKPAVASVSTDEDTMAAGLVITADNSGGAATTNYYEISQITGGKLYTSTGTTPLAENSFITVAEGLAGLRFDPNPDANSDAGDTFSFQVQAAVDTNGNGLSAAKVAAIIVNQVNDKPNVLGEVLDSVEENAGEQVISVDKLLENDKPGPTNESSQTIAITAVANANGGEVRLDDLNTHVIFLPTRDYRGLASFEYTVTDNGTTSGLDTPESATATATFTINGRADAPTVTPASTLEDTQTTSGLEIIPTSGGGAATTHFRITGIQGGRLYQHDGLTPIYNGDFIAVSEGGAGLKFTPDADAHGTTGFGFSVQAAPGTDGLLLSDAVPVSITVIEVNDDPIAGQDRLSHIAKGTPIVTIPFSDLTRNDVAGPADEQLTQTLTVIDVGSAVGGTVSIVDGHVEFAPNSDFMGTASFAYTVSDGGKTDTSQAMFDIVDEEQPTITLNGDETMYVLKGQPYVEPGFGAYDDVDHDLTNLVEVTGSVDINRLGAYELHYDVKDSSNNAAPRRTRTVHIVSSDLSALSVGTDGMAPVFQPDKKDYTLTVPSNVSDLNITANAEDPTATITINGIAKGNGGAQLVALRFGDNNGITLVVTAQGGSTSTYTLQVTRESAPANPGNGNDTGSGNGTQTRQAIVVTGDMTDAHIVPIDITRTTDSNGKIVDSVALQDTKVDELLAKATADGTDKVRIVIDDLPDQPADEVGVNITIDSLRKLKGADLGLVIDASGARITLSADTLSQLSDGGKDLFFRVVPIRKQDETKQVKERVLDAHELQQYANGNNVRAVGQPMMIETNYMNRKTQVMFPLTGIDLPADPQERTAFLNGLAVFVEHTDGQKEVETGQMVYDAAGKLIGLEIDVEKFSTFTFISTDADYTSYTRYVSGYPDGTFHPKGDVKRAELASMIARQLELNLTESKGRYTDLPASHWASKAVLQLTAAGILSGDGDVNGSFRPEQGITRAELATIIAKLKKLNLLEARNTFPDAQGHWAAAAIAAVQQAGLMSGYEGGTFRPDQTVTRAEAVVVLNRLFERPQLKGLEPATWTDVTPSDWASADIASASQDFRVYKDGSITITDFKKPNP